MRLIDADAFKTWIDEYVSAFKKSDKAEIKGYISHQPSIDIVRCGECAKRKKNKFCLEHMRYERDDNGFCSYAEREGE